MTKDFSPPIHSFEAQGWVPTTSQCLSFTLLGQTKFPTRAVGHTLGYEKRLMGLWFQKRISSDSPLPGFFLRLFLRLHSSFGYVGVARTDSSNELNGMIFIFPITFGRDSNWRSIKKRFHGHPKKGLFLERMQAAEDEDAESFWTEYKNKLEKVFACESVFCCKFNLRRSGLLTLKSVDKEYQTGAFAALKMKWLDEPEQSRLNDEEKQKLIRLRFHYVLTQVFGFIKDNLHVHQHHDPYMESISALHFVKYGDQDCLIDKPNPLTRTAHQLHRLVLHFKRSQFPPHHARTKGVMAYLESLIDIIKDKNSGVPEAEKSLKYSLDHVKSSVEARLEEQTWNEVYKTRWISLILIPSIAIAGITIALGSTSSSGGNVDELLLLMKEFSKAHFTRMLFIAIFFFVGLNVLLYGANTVFYPFGKLWTYFGRLAQPFKRRYAGVFWCLLGLVISGAVFFLAIDRLLLAISN